MSSNELYVVVRASKAASDLTQLKEDIANLSKDQKIFLVPRLQTKNVIADIKKDIQKIESLKSAVISLKPRLNKGNLTDLKKDISAIEDSLTINLTPQMGKQKSGVDSYKGNLASQEQYIKNQRQILKSMDETYRISNKDSAGGSYYSSLLPTLQAAKKALDDMSVGVQQNVGNIKSYKDNVKNLFTDLKNDAKTIEQALKTVNKAETSLANTQSKISGISTTGSGQSSQVAEQQRIVQLNQQAAAAIRTQILSSGASGVDAQLLSDLALGADRAKSSLQALNATVKGSDKTNALTKSYATLTAQMENYRKVNSNIENNQRLLKHFDELHLAAVQQSKDLSQLRAEWKTFTNTVNSSGNSGKRFTDQIAEKAIKFTEWFSVSQVIMRGVMELHNMYEAVKNVDTAMVELKKVTDETVQSYDNILNRATDTAKELGAKVSDVVNSTADFARIGYDVLQAEDLARAATVYKNVGDGIEDIGTASESIISTMKAFNVTAEDSMSIVDKFNEVGNTSPISSVGIGEALLRSASALAAANNTLDESIGLITAANTVVQDPDVVGTGLKTMSMRIRGAKTELEEAGLDTENMAESVAKLRESILGLSGVDIMADDTTFKSTYDILVELSQVWDTLTDIAQADIIEKIAGNDYKSCPGRMETCVVSTTLNPVSTKAFLATA